VDDFNDVMANDVGTLQDSIVSVQTFLKAVSLSAEFKNVEALSADKTLTDADYLIQRLDCNGANRVLYAPPSAAGNHAFWIVNSSAGAYNITFKSNSGTTTYAIIAQGQAVFGMPDGNGGYMTVSVDMTAFLAKTGLTEWDEQGSDPSTPASGKWKVYLKADGLYIIDDAGVITGPMISKGGTFPNFTRASVVVGVANPTADYTARTSVYVFPYGGGDTYQQWTGSKFLPQVFVSQTLSLYYSGGSGHASGSVYDIYLWMDGTTQRVVTGPAWASTTSRGTGAGTAEIETLNGVNVNKVSMTVRNGATTYTMPARYGTVIGSICPSANGQVSWSQTNRGISNMYNQEDVIIRSCPGYANDNANTTWSVTSSVFTKANGGTGSDLKFVLCKPQQVLVSIYAMMTVQVYALIGIGFDSGTSPTRAAWVYSAWNSMSVQDSAVLIEGSHYAAFLVESGSAGTFLADTTRYGASADPEVTFIEATIKA
jgi:hypothetical protein